MRSRSGVDVLRTENLSLCKFLFAKAMLPFTVTSYSVKRCTGLGMEHEVEDNYITVVLEVTWCDVADESKLRSIIESFQSY
jgi:hypothetical protein